MEKRYSVWVGGIEVNDFLLGSREEAEELADKFIAKDYDDVVIEEIV